MGEKKKLQINNERCVGCRKCENLCVMGAITIINENGYIDEDLCNNCGMCIEACHRYAIG